MPFSDDITCDTIQDGCRGRDLDARKIAPLTQQLASPLGYSTHKRKILSQKVFCKAGVGYKPVDDNPAS